MRIVLRIWPLSPVPVKCECAKSGSASCYASQFLISFYVWVRNCEASFNLSEGNLLFSPFSFSFFPQIFSTNDIENYFPGNSVPSIFMTLIHGNFGIAGAIYLV